MESLPDKLRARQQPGSGGGKPTWRGGAGWGGGGGGGGGGGVTPVLDYGELSPGSGTSLLLCPEDNSPFSSWARRDKSTSSDNLDNPYSQISGISTYEDYEGG